jgi:hypothetical protein
MGTEGSESILLHQCRDLSACVRKPSSTAIAVLDEKYAHLEDNHETFSTSPSGVLDVVGDENDEIY